ncbi:MAG: peroxiredoxin [Cyanobacteria bacterium M_DeepCast_100m_m1_067]|nr:peroxiredoxin [Cyanobacteria bacterium M_DeepCast_100m_m1_067]
MQRRAVLRSLVALVPASLGATSLLAFGRQVFALGGTLPALNQPAPDFALPGITPAADGQAIETRLQLADFRGRWLVLYFYPRDFTGGCTLEARGFQKDLAAYEAANAAVVGISADDAESHADFCSSEGLAFPLLSDPAGTVSRTYGSWIAPFSQRHTFLIDPTGVLRSTWVAVRPTGHSAEVLAALQELQASR